MFLLQSDPQSYYLQLQKWQFLLSPSCSIRAHESFSLPSSALTSEPAAFSPASSLKVPKYFDRSPLEGPRAYLQTSSCWLQKNRMRIQQRPSDPLIWVSSTLWLLALTATLALATEATLRQLLICNITSLLSVPTITKLYFLFLARIFKKSQIPVLLVKNLSDDRQQEHV